MIKMNIQKIYRVNDNSREALVFKKVFLKYKQKQNPSDWVHLHYIG